MLSEMYACIQTEYTSVLVLRNDVVLTSTLMYIWYESIKSQMPDRESNPIESNAARVKHETHTIWCFASMFWLFWNLEVTKVLWV